MSSEVITFYLTFQRFSWFSEVYSVWRQTTNIFPKKTKDVEIMPNFYFQRCE